MTRFLFGLMLLLAVAAAPASAQARFIQACASSPDMQQLEGLDAGALCTCVATKTIQRGITAADLDRSIDFGAESLGSAPPEIRAVAETALESTVSCAMAQQGGLAGMAQGAPMAPSTGASAAVRPQAPALPAGLRTGSGTPPVRADQAGAGAALVIRE